MDALIETDSAITPLRVVFAAGNHRQGRAHALFGLQTGQTENLLWRIQPDDRTPSFLQLWLQPNVGAKVQVTIQSPIGDFVTVTEGTSQSFLGPLGFLFGASYVAAPSARPHVEVRLEPSAPATPLDLTQPTIPAGLWRITIRNVGTAHTEVDAYIERDDTLPGRRANGRQSYFDDPNYQTHDNFGRRLEFNPNPNRSVVTRQGTLSGTATGRFSYVIGGYRRNVLTTEQLSASYSSEGPVAANSARTMKSPNWLAPSDDSIACHGVLAAGTRSGSSVAMSGSSVASPQAARWYADQFANGTPPGFGIPPGLMPPGSRVPPTDVPLVAGDGLMALGPLPRSLRGPR